MAPSPDKPKMTIEEGIEALVRRFDIIIGLLLERQQDESKEDGPLSSTEGRSVRLFRLGMAPAEIARLSGRTGSNIRRDLSKARKIGFLPKAPTRSRDARETQGGGSQHRRQDKRKTTSRRRRQRR